LIDIRPTTIKLFLAHNAYKIDALAALGVFASILAIALIVSWARGPQGKRTYGITHSTHPIGLVPWQGFFGS